MMQVVLGGTHRAVTNRLRSVRQRKYKAPAAGDRRTERRAGEAGRAGPEAGPRATRAPPARTRSAGPLRPARRRRGRRRRRPPARRDGMIGYLAVTAQEPLGYLGGVLVADEYGLPVEFRHTLPVRPTKLQRALYGSALDR